MHPVAEAIAAAAPAIAMVAVFMLFAGGVVLIRRGRGTRNKGLLMIVCAAVLLGNVLIWTL
ncbi:hypothetical protein KY084_01310 [Stakelama sp. CBK3Z-3]|uniref:LPXTG cell wall anchor domain-containing protein n=1 Tax=Stakelama flava TaxID=2860338 RepID=A0ABS6XH33_9SPHN|nr:hypothetical protein [Stakelama flava]MBW4329515.1 hypothetical protein [Stakelama flava]